MFPLIPVVCVAGFIASALGLTWYESLPSEKQEEADRIAADLAMRWYSKRVENLAQHELDAINSALNKKFFG